MSDARAPASALSPQDASSASALEEDPDLDFTLEDVDDAPVDEDLVHDLEMELDMELENLDSDIPSMVSDPKPEDTNGQGQGPETPVSDGTPATADTGFKNRTALVAFLAFTAVVVVLEFVDLSGSYPGKGRTIFILIMSCIISAALGVGCICTWIWVTQQLIWFTQFASICFMVFYSFFLLILRDEDNSLGWKLSAVIFSCAVILSIWLWRTTKDGKLQYAAVFIEMISKLVKENTAIITVSGVILLFQSVWLAIFAVAAFQSTQFQHYGTFQILLAVTYYWTTQVFKNILHTAASGTVTYWYYHMNAPMNDAEKTSSTYSSLKRACTYSLGSICYGSFFVSAVRWIRLPFRYCMRSRFAFIRRIFRTPAAALDSLHERFNKYAFRHVVMYGKDFRAASSATWRQFCARGVDSIIEEDKVDTLLLLPCIGGACFVASFCGIWAYYADLPHWHIMSLVALLVGFATVTYTTEIIEAFATTIYGCFAEEPYNLSEANPLIFHRFVRISEFSAFKTRRVDDSI